MGRVSLLYFSSSKWYPYPFFYRLEAARYLDEPSAMHGWEVLVNSPIAFCLIRQLSFFHDSEGPHGLFWVSERGDYRSTWAVVGQLAWTFKNGVSRRVSQ
jgi:hypothetical protein